MDRSVGFLVAAFVVSLCSIADAGDWPQILGPERNAIARNEKLADKWPKSGPKKIWEQNVGSGFAGVAVSDGIVVLFHREKNEDKLSGYDAQSGDPLWSTSFLSNFRPQIVDDDGPRAVPTIHEGAIYALSAEGKLYCVELKSGKKRWERKTHQDYGASGGYFGAGSAPVVEDGLVIVNVGGDKKKAGIVAFRTENGDTAWSAVDDQASYSAPIVASINGSRHLLCVTRLNFVSLDPASGKERFRTPFGQRGPTVNGATPVVLANHVLLTSSYGIGGQWLEVGDQSSRVVWSDDILSSQYTTPVAYEGAIYGVDGRQDGGEVTLKCFDPESRKEYWSQSGLSYATLIAADGMLLVMQTDGELKLVKLTTRRYEELASAKLLPGISRALPALAGGRFYVRNERTLACFDLSRQ